MVERKGHDQFNVGDLIAYDDGDNNMVMYYISSKSRWGNRGQYRFDLTALRTIHRLDMIGKKYASYNTGRLNDRIQFWDWKHIPVNNGSKIQKTKKV